MPDVDPLVAFRDAALACNDAAKNTLALLQSLNSGQETRFSPFALPFPRGQTLPGRPGETFEEAVRRTAFEVTVEHGPSGETVRHGAIVQWSGELQKALDGWNAAVGLSNVLEQIKQAAVSLHLPPLQIGIDSFATGHEAAERRASELLHFLQGRTQALRNEITLDLRGRIEQEYQEAARPHRDPVVALTPEEKTILEALAKEGSMTITQEALAGQTRLSDRTVRKYVGELRTRGFVNQPRGPKKGFAITDTGLAAIRRK